MVRITPAALRRLTAARVSKYMEHADGTVLVEFFPPSDLPAPTARQAKPEPEPPAEPSPDEWLSQQYSKPDGT